MRLFLRNQTCHLLCERAVYWEEQKTLIFADIHLGKEIVFQKAGIPIPQRIMEDDLAKIGQLINFWNPLRCIIVGDLIHGAKGITDHVKTRFSEWLKALPCEVHLVLGNHDRPLIKNFPQEWSLHVHVENLVIEPFCFAHHPVRHPHWFVWSGHLHPKVEITDGYDRLVLRCFQVFKDLAILPAFGFFVGGAFVKRGPSNRIYAITEKSIFEV